MIDLILATALNVATCSACHDAGGATVPVLNGQPAMYLELQLKAFRSRQRVSPVMNAMAAGLTDAQIKQFAEYFSKQGCK